MTLYAETHLPLFTDITGQCLNKASRFGSISSVNCGPYPCIYIYIYIYIYFFLRQHQPCCILESRAERLIVFSYSHYVNIETLFHLVQPGLHLEAWRVFLNSLQIVENFEVRLNRV
jgi:hypothetical protein